MLVRNCIRQLPAFLQLRLGCGLISEKKQPGHNLIFIRHGQSEYNQACEQYREKNRIPYVWSQLCSHQGFNQEILYNYRFVDTRLNHVGKSECQKTRDFLEEEDIGCVIVSPQTRALETFTEVMGHKRIPTFAEPLLSGPLRSCCDLSRQTVPKLNEFPSVNFGSISSLEDLWFLDYLTFEQQSIVNRRLHQKGIKSFQGRCEEILQMLKEGLVLEDAFQYRKRIQLAKHRIAHYQRKYDKVAIFCHYYTIEYISAQRYQPDGAPVLAIDIKNCQPYFARIEDLLEVKEEGFQELSLDEEEEM